MHSGNPAINGARPKENIFSNLTVDTKIERSADGVGNTRRNVAGKGVEEKLVVIPPLIPVHQAAQEVATSVASYASRIADAAKAAEAMLSATRKLNDALVRQESKQTMSSPTPTPASTPTPTSTPRPVIPPVYKPSMPKESAVSIEHPLCKITEKGRIVIRAEYHNPASETKMAALTVVGNHVSHCFNAFVDEKRQEVDIIKVGGYLVLQSREGLKTFGSTMKLYGLPSASDRVREFAEIDKNGLRDLSQTNDKEQMVWLCDSNPSGRPMIRIQDQQRNPEIIGQIFADRSMAVFEFNETYSRTISYRQKALFLMAVVKCYYTILKINSFLIPVGLHKSRRHMLTSEVITSRCMNFVRLRANRMDSNGTIYIDGFDCTTREVVFVIELHQCDNFMTVKDECRRTLCTVAPWDSNLFVIWGIDNRMLGYFTRRLNPTAYYSADGRDRVIMGHLTRDKPQGIDLPADLVAERGWDKEGSWHNKSHSVHLSAKSGVVAEIIPESTTVRLSMKADLSADHRSMVLATLSLMAHCDYKLTEEYLPVGSYPYHSTDKI